MSDLIERQAAIDAIIEDKICDDSLKIMIALGEGDKAETLNMTCDRHAKMLMSLPSAQSEPLTDKEQRIFLAAMRREEKVCRQVDGLVRTCHEIIRKVKGTLWT